MMPNDLNAKILQAHDAGELEALASLYRQAGDRAHAQGDIDEACFFFTTAYVFALDTGQNSLSNALHAKLVAYGREE